jgi:hypothetical protein
MVAHPHSMDFLLQVVAMEATAVRLEEAVVQVAAAAVLAIQVLGVVVLETLHLHLHHKVTTEVADMVNHSAVLVVLAVAQDRLAVTQVMRQVATAVAVHLAHLADHLSHTLAVAVEAFITNSQEHQEAVDRVVEVQVVKRLRQQTARMV